VLDAGEEFPRRGRRLEAQIERMRRVWSEARASDSDAGVLGPAPLQKPGPPVWIGAVVERAIDRAVRIADGFVFGALGVRAMAEQAPALRERARGHGKPAFELVGTAYIAVGERARARAQGVHGLLRYYGDRLWSPPEDVLHYGPVEEIREIVAGYADCDLDQMILFTEIAELEQVEQLAESVLPDYL
jgi:alkanesulfonate monooxygenase SsuD/methylene tetrahydromethanopterin reductase-like flavin-dependent oxidoreductase (luciferase family)